MSYSRVGLAYNRRTKCGLYVLCLFLFFSFVILVHVCKTLVIPLLHCMTCRGGLHCCAQCSLMFELFFFFFVLHVQNASEKEPLFLLRKVELYYTLPRMDHRGHIIFSACGYAWCAALFFFLQLLHFFILLKRFLVLYQVFLNDQVEHFLFPFRFHGAFIGTSSCSFCGRHHLIIKVPFFQPSKKV